MTMCETADVRLSTIYRQDGDSYHDEPDPEDVSIAETRIDGTMNSTTGEAIQTEDRSPAKSPFATQENPSPSLGSSRTERILSGNIQPRFPRKTSSPLASECSGAPPHLSFNVSQTSATGEEGGNEDLKMDDPSRWIEYVNPEDNSRLYYNQALRQVSVVGVGKDVEQVEVNRAFGMAVHQALTQEKDIHDGEAPDGEGREEEEEVEEDVVDEVRYFMDKMSRIQEMLQNVQKKCPTIPPEILRMVESMVDGMNEVKAKVEELSLNIDQGDIKALLSWNKIHWNWENKHVGEYRRAAAHKWKRRLYDQLDRADDSKSILSSMYKTFDREIAYKQWHMPRYYSDAPIPRQKKPLTLRVLFPEVSKNSEKTRGKSGTLVQIREHETARLLIRRCLKKCQIAPQDTETYALKAIGFKDYLTGSDRLLSMECIIDEIRSGRQPVLQLVPQPEVIERTEEELKAYKENFINYFQESIDSEEPLVASPPSTNGVWPVFHSSGFPLECLEQPFRLRAVGVEHCVHKCLPRLSGGTSLLKLRCFLFYGDRIILFDAYTPEVPVAESARWMTQLDSFDDKNTRMCYYKDIPRLCRIGFVLYEVIQESSRKKIQVPIAYVATQLMDSKGILVQGRQSYNMWPCLRKHKKEKDPGNDVSFIFRKGNRENLSSRSVCTITLDFERFAYPVIGAMHPTSTYRSSHVVGSDFDPSGLSKAHRAKIFEISKMDILDNLKKEHTSLLWRMRHSLMQIPSLLPKFLRSIVWEAPAIRDEAHMLLLKWAPPRNPSDALILLDVSFPDPLVREYALSCLRRLSDNELRLYLLQLTQCLKYEAYNDSPLSRFMIERALQNPMVIGHSVFWHLKAEMEFSPKFCERYALILEEYLSLCGPHLNELLKQHHLNLKLEAVSARIVQLKREEKNSSMDCKKEMRAQLSEINETFFKKVGSMQVPLNPKLEVRSLIVEECKYMSSKMVPLWLVFRNADRLVHRLTDKRTQEKSKVYIIFKSGDDLRQDILTLQILKVMDRLWLAAGYDLRLNIYKVLATGVNARNEGVGMIEVVLNSMTTSGIQLKYGGGASGAFNPKCLYTFLQTFNSNNNFERSVENFTRSCAGYCVATFVMGIGDRHNDNIMCTKDGYLFHIDFGHFLGNFKKKYGFNRERTAFVFTPEMAYVMTEGKAANGKKQPYNQFLHLAKAAYHTCRESASFLETLFLLMVPAGMPELLKASDILYLKQKLYLNLTHTEAGSKLDDEINNCKSNVYRQIDNWIHNLKHGGK
ncbi:hypothetical protein AAMO2058_001372800 [Amorphochlora amoebiformis]